MPSSEAEETTKETTTESQEVDKELAEKIINELTGGLGSDMEPEELERKKGEIEREVESVLSMSERRPERFEELKKFLEKERQEAENKGEEFNRLYEMRTRIIGILEESKEKEVK